MVPATLACTGMAFALLDQQRALVDAAQRLASLAPETFRVSNEKLPAALILVTLLHRGTKTLRGAILLCEAGHGEQALSSGERCSRTWLTLTGFTSHPGEAVSDSMTRRYLRRN
jgi:hypothetical protein